MSFESLLRAATPSDNMTKLEELYEGKAHLDALGVSLPPAVRVLEMVAPFPKMAVDVLSEVLNPEGFLLGDDVATPKLLRQWWQANNLDTEIKLAIVETLVQGESFLIVGPGDGGTPRITAHRRDGMAVSRDHMGRVDEAIRRYKIGDRSYAAHYLPGETRYFENRSSQWRPVRENPVVKTGATRPAVVPLVNKARLGDVRGRSEFVELAKTTDAASRTLTNLQVAQELLAMPTRYLFGDGLEMMRDQNGNPIDKITAYFGHFLTGPAGAQAGSIPGGDLSQIINTYKLYAQIVSSVTGIPPSMLGISTDNPASAEAMRVAKDRLITKAEAKQNLFGDALEDVAKLALEMEGETPDGIDTLELQWRDPATPSVSAKAANLLQAHGQGVISAETARDGLQLTPEQKARESARSERADAFRAQVGA